MNDAEVISLLTRLYFIKGFKTRHEIMKEINIDTGGVQYKKFEAILQEFVSYGFIIRIKDNPPTYSVDKKCKDKMWHFMRNSRVGEAFLNIATDNGTLVLE